MLDYCSTRTKSGPEGDIVQARRVTGSWGNPPHQVMSSVMSCRFGHSLCAVHRFLIRIRHVDYFRGTFSEEDLGVDFERFKLTVG